jgi:hypothetical protein
MADPHDKGGEHGEKDGGFDLISHYRFAPLLSTRLCFRKINLICRKATTGQKRLLLFQKIDYDLVFVVGKRLTLTNKF